ncbi:MAG: hypoxanthine phosphoribosyltransferase [Lentisphaeria bacterium]|nr:hypoxanthine phosphoribosyltransferase [Lentisphaeria bacterium]
MSVTLSPLYDAEAIRRRVSELAADISRTYAGQELTAIIVMNGGLFFAADLLRGISIPVRIDSLPAGSYTHHLSTGELKMRGRLKLAVEGRHVLLIDDILDTGFTLAEIRKKVLADNAASCRNCVLIDKDIPPEKKKAKADWYGFRAPEEFLVGYGMDSDELYRNLPDICILRENEN